MVKTRKEYEASDVDLKDPVHRYLSTVILIGTLAMTRKGGDGSVDSERLLHEAVAMCLTAADTQDIVLTTRERVPEAFRSDL